MPMAKRRQVSYDINPHAARRLHEAAADLRASLQSAYPDILHDQDLWRDTLDGETDAIDTLRKMCLAAIDIRIAAEAAKAAKTRYQDRIAELSTREKRFDDAAHRVRSAIAAIMEDIGIPDLKEPEFTVFFQNGQRWLATEPDPQALPDEYVEWTPKVRTDKLLAALRAGEEVEGAPPLTNPARNLVIRTK